MNRILILVPHFDDDVLSFGGLIIKELEKGSYIHVHVFTAGGPCSNVSLEVRIKEYQNVMRFLGVQEYTYSGFNQDGLLDRIPNSELTGMIDKMINEFKPTTVCCGAYSEHCDHIALYKAFMGSARLKSGYMPSKFIIGTYPFSDQLYTQQNGGKMFYILSDEHFNKKCEAFKLYKSQFKESPSPLGLDGLINQAKYYGMLSGGTYAELFYIIRIIEK